MFKIVCYGTLFIFILMVFNARGVGKGTRCLDLRDFCKTSEIIIKTHFLAIKI